MIKVNTPAGRDRNGHKIKMIVVHAMSEYIMHDGKELYAPHFLNKIGLSCHYMVLPHGGIMECSDPENRIAWHAKGFNENSVGIELLVPGLHDYESFLDAIKKPKWSGMHQRQSLVKLTYNLFSKFGNDLQVVRHSDIDPENKKDPGEGFQWDWFMKIIGNWIKK